jgi:hypothetical protein
MLLSRFKLEAPLQRHEEGKENVAITVQFISLSSSPISSSDTHKLGKLAYLEEILSILYSKQQHFNNNNNLFLGIDWGICEKTIFFSVLMRKISFFG